VRPEGELIGIVILLQRLIEIEFRQHVTSIGMRHFCCELSSNCASSKAARNGGTASLNAFLPTLWPISADSNMMDRRGDGSPS